MLKDEQYLHKGIPLKTSTTSPKNLFTIVESSSSVKRKYDEMMSTLETEVRDTLMCEFCK